MSRGAVLGGAVLALLLGAVFVFNASAKMPDFEVYWRAGARALAAEALYRAEDGHYQFKYLPAFALAAIPAALIPLPAAKAIWFAISAALIARLLGLSLGLLPVKQLPPALLVTATLVAMAKFYGHELVLGQVNVLFAVVVLLAVHGHLAGRPVAAGLLTAAAVIVKPYAVIFLPWFAAQRSCKAFAAAFGGVAGALVVPAIAYGPGGAVALHRDWWRTVSESTAPNLLNPDNVSLAGMYAKWLGAGSVAAWMTLVTCVLLLVAAGYVFRMRERVAAPSGLEAVLLLTLIPLLSPQGWDYVFLVSTPAVMYALNYNRSLPAGLRALTWLALAAIAFSLYDLIGRRAYASFMAWSVITVCYLVLVAALVTLRVRRAA